MIHLPLSFGIVLSPMFGFLLIILAMAFAFWAQMKVKSTYNKYSKVPSRGGITGYEAAEAVMRKAGITDVEIVHVPGVLTDHYDPVNKRLALSDNNFRGSSLAAIGVAAHEAGHAIQHKVGYSMMNIRQQMAPVVNIAAGFLPLVMFGGLFLGLLPFKLAIDLGIIIYAMLTLFHLVTLPVEYDATARAKRELDSLGIIYADEAPGVSATLSAAGLTYVAAFAGSLFNLVYLILLRGRD
jgi:uncharacterized protein